ncbi:TPA: hypothetical protein ACGY8F_002566 [Stenotrophomonas maltophilia]
MNTDDLTDRQLLDLHCTVMDAWRQRGVIRSANNPVADYTETLVARAFNATLATGSQAGFDAVGPEGTRPHIKGRRLTAANKSTQLSALRNWRQTPSINLPQSPSIAVSTLNALR